MRYEEPRMEVLELEAEDIITVSNNGLSDGTTESGNNTNVGEGSEYEW